MSREQERKLLIDNVSALSELQFENQRGAHSRAFETYGWRDDRLKLMI